MLIIQEDVNIKDYSTFKIGGLFKYLIEIHDINDLKEAFEFAQNKSIRLFVLGGGSNIVFSDGVLNVVALKNEVKGFSILKDTDTYTDIKIGAGEIWDKVVEKTIDMNLSGLEALSFIPGTVGATPVQNVGAYGTEVKDTILKVEAYDFVENKIVDILNKDCHFGYRDSIFKNKEKGRYFITGVVYRLLKNNYSIPNYPGVLKYFESLNIKNPNLKQIREAIIYIRSDKLPNPNEIPNVGSFFKNPIVDKSIAERILEKFPNAKFFPVDDNFTKIPAGWLIENSELKGKIFGNISVYSKNALVLVNNGNATKEDLINAKDEIIKIVQDKFGITLEQEPEII